MSCNIDFRLAVQTTNRPVLLIYPHTIHSQCLTQKILILCNIVWHVDLSFHSPILYTCQIKIRRRFESRQMYCLSTQSVGCLPTAFLAPLSGIEPDSYALTERLHALCIERNMSTRGSYRMQDDDQSLEVPARPSGFMVEPVELNHFLLHAIVDALPLS